NYLVLRVITQTPPRFQGGQAGDGHFFVQAEGHDLDFFFGHGKFLHELPPGPLGGNEKDIGNFVNQAVNAAKKPASLPAVRQNIMHGVNVLRGQEPETKVEKKPLEQNQLVAKDTRKM